MSAKQIRVTVTFRGVMTGQPHEIQRIGRQLSKAAEKQGLEGLTLSFAPAKFTDRSVSRLLKGLNQLNPRYRRILELRYGLTGEEPYTLDQLGRIFNVTRERIKQVESNAWSKLELIAAKKSRARTP